jgi:hypothetical protein
MTLQNVNIAIVDAILDAGYEFKKTGRRVRPEIAE